MNNLIPFKHSVNLKGVASTPTWDYKSTSMDGFHLCSRILIEESISLRQQTRTLSLFVLSPGLAVRADSEHFYTSQEATRRFLKKP